MYRTYVHTNGNVYLGDDAIKRLGFEPGTLVEVVCLSSGNILITKNNTPPTYDTTWRPLEGGAAQLAIRRGERERD